MNRWYETIDIDRVATPAVLVYPERIEANLNRLIDVAGDPSRLRPHVKTHKMPPVIQLQLAMGITKFKVATIAEAEMTAAAGGEDILVAYPLVGPNPDRFMRLARTFPQTRFAAIVDNESAVRMLSAAARTAGRRAIAYVDLDVGMHRTGIAVDCAEHLAQRIAEDDHLCFGGLHAYDGHVRGVAPEELDAAVDRTFESVWPLWRRVQCLRDDDSAMPLGLVAGGTPTSGSLLRHADVEVSAGTVVFYDAGQETLSPGLGFQAAATVATRVVSTFPRASFGEDARGDDEGRRLCLDLGHKSVASEMPMPRVTFLNLPGGEMIGHSEEHMIVRCDGGVDISVGDVIYALPMHICPTISLHQHVGVVQDHRVVDQWPVVARDRCITI